MKDLKNRAERILLYMLNMDPSDTEPHMGLECSPIYKDGKEDPATAVQIYGPIECDVQPLLFTAHRWPGADTIWTADIITDAPHVIDELLVHTSDLEAENGRLRRRLGKETARAEAGEKLCISLQGCPVKLPPGVRTYITNYYERIKSLG
nr:hypothetical protein [Pseudodesulfovibrio sp.]